MNWILSKVKYTEQQKSGALKRVSPFILVEAVTFGEAEAKIYDQVQEFAQGGINISTMNRVEFVEIMEDQKALNPYYYILSITQSVIDKDTAKEKREKFRYLVLADTTQKAEKVLNDQLEDILINYKVTGVVESQIVEVFK